MAQSSSDIFKIDSFMLSGIQAGFDSILNEFSQTCKLVYPPKITACSCAPDLIGQKPQDWYSTGNPAPILMPGCELCGGTGKQTTSATANIEMVCSWDLKVWDQLVPNIKVPRGSLLTQGFMTDFTKVKQAQELILLPEVVGHFRFKLAGGPINPFSIVKDRYFLAVWAQITG